MLNSVIRDSTHTLGSLYSFSGIGQGGVVRRMNQRFINKIVNKNVNILSAQHKCRKMGELSQDGKSTQNRSSVFDSG